MSKAGVSSGAARQVGESRERHRPLLPPSKAAGKANTTKHSHPGMTGLFLSARHDRAVLVSQA